MGLFSFIKKIFGVKKSRVRVKKSKTKRPAGKKASRKPVKPAKKAKAAKPVKRTLKPERIKARPEKQKPASGAERPVKKPKVVPADRPVEKGPKAIKQKNITAGPKPAAGKVSAKIIGPRENARPAAEAAGVTQASAEVKLVTAGLVTHYFDKISVGIITLNAPLKVGDKIWFKSPHTYFTQTVQSIQINHQNVAQGARGDMIGVKVLKPVCEGDNVFLEPAR